jgi:hypothetical protein
MTTANFALTHPWGARIVDLQDEMGRMVGIEATHNALLFLTAVLGVPAGLLVLGRLAWQVLTAYGRDIAVIAIVVALQFMFEEAIIGPSILFAFFLTLNSDISRFARMMAPYGRFAKALDEQIVRANALARASMVRADG